MFIGHYAVALAVKPHAASVSLGTLLLACQLADLIWPSLVLLGIETVEIDPGNTAMTPLLLSPGLHRPCGCWSPGGIGLIDIENRFD